MPTSKTGTPTPTPKGVQGKRTKPPSSKNADAMQATPSASSTSSPTLPLPSIFGLIHQLHTTITESIDTSLSWDQLNSPPVNYTLVRPIVERLVHPDTGSASGTTTKTHGKNRGQDNGVEGLLGIPSDDEEGRVSSKTLGTRAGGEGLGMVLYALMANRIQFIGLAGGDLSYAPLQTSRAAFCELLAIKVLRTFPHPEQEADLVGQLVRGWCAFDGAPEEVWQSMGDDRGDIAEMRGSALELAIVSNAKHFLSLPLIQHLVNQIYVGHLVYSPSSSRSLITDTYISPRTRARRRPSHSSLLPPSQPRPSLGRAADVHGAGEGEGEELAEVYMYNPYESSWLDHHRLRVPKWRKWLEFLSFAILMSLFVATLAVKELDRAHPVEVVFIIVTFGFMLDEFAASKEHGWTVLPSLLVGWVLTDNQAWNAFDLAYITVFLLYLILRIFGLASDSPRTSDLAFDILACAACILFPRLVFYLIKDNVVILALKGMIAKFVGFMGLTIVAFSGICFCLWTLGRGTWTVKQIVWLMLQIWFGSSYLGFSSSESFHPIFGPIILIGYAALCNVLLITILISILSNEFAEINANAQAEHLFQKVVKTVEGVKSDAIFSYLPPLNILAFGFLGPASYVCSPRTLHRINVFCIRLTSFPILLAISVYERWEFRSKRTIQLQPSASMDRLVNPGLFELICGSSFLGSGSEILISSVFEASPSVDTASKPKLGVDTATATKPRRASSVTSAEDDRDSEDVRPGSESPLAKVFGHRITSIRGGPRPASPTTTVKLGQGVRAASADEVDVLKKELSEVRASQLRMEEMLAKMLSGGGRDK